MSPIDRDLLTACITARDRIAEAETALAQARTGFEASVRRLYVEGTSTREIAEALGLSHQRIHQIVGGGRSWWQRLLGQDGVANRACTFCARGAGAVARLVAGPGDLYICNDCTAAAVEILTGAGETRASPLAREEAGSQRRCSFCRTRKRGTPLATAGGHRICPACARFAGQIIAE